MEQNGSGAEVSQNNQVEDLNPPFSPEQFVSLVFVRCRIRILGFPGLVKFKVANLASDTSNPPNQTNKQGKLMPL
jgi:hypothetical protein